MKPQHSLHVSSSLKVNHTFVLIGIILVSFTLRSPITAVGPLVQMIRNDLGISNSSAGLLTTIPLLAFAVLSFYSFRLGSRFGNQMVIFIGLLLLCAGIILRSAGSVPFLFLGTVIIGIGIAVSNVLLPSLVKEFYPEKIGIITGLYSTSMGFFAALGSGLSVPLAQEWHLEWQKSLLVWIIMVVVAICIWIPQLFHPSSQRKKQTAVHTQKTNNIWKSTTAWQLTLYMGLQSLLFYCSIAWLPEIMQRVNGISSVSSGWLLLVMQIAALPSTFLVPILAQKWPHHQKTIVIVISILTVVGFSVLLIGSGLLVLSMILLGISQGANLSFTLVMIGMKASNAAEATKLSGMAQGVGYGLASIGPLLMGFLLDLTGSTNMLLMLFIIIAILLMIDGLGVSQGKQVHKSS